MKLLQIHDRDLTPTADGGFDPQSAVCSDRGGGLAVYLADLVGGLRRRNDRVSVIEFEPDVDGHREAGPGYHRLQSFRFRVRRSTVARFRRIVDQEDPDVVHLHAVYHELHPLMLRRLAKRRPVIWTPHNVRPVCFRGTKLHPDDRMCGRPVGLGCLSHGCYRLGSTTGVLSDVARVLSNPVYLAAYRRLDKIVVPSRYLKDLLVANGFCDGRIDVVPLFSRFAACAGAASVGAGPDRILFVGRLDQKKGIESFLEALAILRHRPWEAVIVGDGKLFEPLRTLVQRHELADRVSFVGDVTAEHLAGHYRACSFVVFPSLIPEAFGLVGVEAMSFGKAVVAFDSGGVNEWLQDGVTGLLADHGQVEHLAKLIDRLIADRGLSSRLGENGRCRADQCFTLEHHLDRMQSIYADQVEAFRMVGTE